MFLLVGVVDHLVNEGILDAEGTDTIGKLPLVKNFLNLNQSKENEESNIVVEVKTVPES